jgi:hypothetical protein
MARGHGACGPRTPLAEAVGFDDREDFWAIGGEERDDEPGSVRKATVDLRPGDAELEVDGSQHVQGAAREGETVPRTVLDLAPREPLEARLDSLDRVLRRKQLLHVGFPQVERHRRVL